MTITAIIISGGRASRMGGIDKGLISLNGKPLVKHVIERISPQVDEVLINANRELTQYKAFGLPVLKDENADFIGPLAGFSLGLHHAKHDLVLTVPCDVPLLPEDLVARLSIELTKHDADIVVANSEENAHPIISLCKKNILPSLIQYIDDGERKISTWQKNQHYREVEFNAFGHAFYNVNTQSDLVKLAKLINKA